MLKEQKTNRYFINISYHGKNYHGWQIQPNANSVQEEIQIALSQLLNTETQIVGAGRTDAGVHAKQLFAHFDTKDDLLCDELCHKLNAFIADDIVINNIKKVKSDLHARFSAKKRSYEYQIYLGRNPFLLETTWQIYKQQLDIDKMNECAKLLLEFTNFKCFSKSKTDVHTYNCTIFEAKWILKENHLTFHITANRFLRNMVRAIVGTLYEVGLGKLTTQQFIKVIESKDRKNAGISVPARALFLTKIEY